MTRRAQLGLGLLPVILLGHTQPGTGVVGRVVVFLVPMHDVCVSKENQSDGPSGRAGIHRLPKPVENKNL